MATGETLAPRTSVLPPGVGIRNLRRPNVPGGVTLIHMGTRRAFTAAYAEGQSAGHPATDAYVLRPGSPANAVVTAEAASQPADHPRQPFRFRRAKINRIGPTDLPSVCRSRRAI